jgi:hypothetical protein
MDYWFIIEMYFLMAVWIWDVYQYIGMDLWSLLICISSLLESGKNNAYHNVNKVQNQYIYEWILNLIDIVVCVVFVLNSSLMLSYLNRYDMIW